ncbi:hypothetical protein GGS26DRAFT_558698 [Hypomontagnella submonticulosa]|nr:hypothetical protein GGS26DRAFT_558698 [Hypomontagnella submonticulosa]
MVFLGFRKSGSRSDNDLADPIRCQLQAHSLTEQGQIPQYTALSYVWGDQNFDLPIECDDRSLLVNSGRFQALSYLRNLLRRLRKFG